MPFRQLYAHTLSILTRRGERGRGIKRYKNMKNGAGGRGRRKHGERCEDLVLTRKISACNETHLQTKW